MDKTGKSKTWNPLGRIKKLNFPSNLNDESILTAWIPVYLTNSWLLKKIPELTKVPLADITEVQSFKTSKRLEEYLSGRYLLGELMKLWEPQIDLTLIVVKRNKITRAPYLTWVKGCASNIELPNFSISHAGGIAACILSNSNVSIGIDLESLDEKRTKNILSIIAKGDEKQQLITDWETNSLLGKRNSLCVWTAKESIQKALNLGMNLNPMSFIIPRRSSDNIPIKNSIFKLKINGNNLNVFTTELQLNNQNSTNNYICSVAKTESLTNDSVKNNISNHGGLKNHQSNVGCKTT